MINKLELKVGIFLITTSLLVAAAIGYVAYKKGVFAKVYTFTLAAKSGDDLTEGMPVVFSGFKIGTVETLTLSSDGSVLIRIKIPEVHAKWIRSDSTFIVNKPLLGSARIVVVTDNLQSPILSPSRTPNVVNVSDINETIKQARPLLDRVTGIAGNLEIMTARLADPRGDVNKIMANIEQLTSKLDDMTARLTDPQGDIHKTLANAEKLTGKLAQKGSLLEMAVSDQSSLDAFYAALKQTKDITEQVETVLQKADQMAAKTDALIYGEEGSLPTVNKALKDVLAKLHKLDLTVENINKISNEAADSTSDLKVLREQVDATITALSSLANELEKKIPFKKTPEIKLP